MNPLTQAANAWQRHARTTNGQSDRQ